MKEIMLTAGADPNYDISLGTIPKEIDPTIPNTISVSITVEMVDPSYVPDSYTINWQRLLDSGANDQNIGSSGQVVSSTKEIKIHELDELRRYRFTITAYKGETTFGNDLILTFTTSGGGQDTANMKQQGIDPNNLTIGKSYLTISNSNENLKKNIYQSLHRTFDALQEPTTSINRGYGLSSGGVSQYWTTYSDTYYSFGTRFYFDPTVDYQSQGAAIGFFIDSTGTNGYYLVIESTFYSASKERNGVRIIKVGDGTPPKKLFDTQTNQSNTLDGIYSGTQFDVDIKVKVSGANLTIKAYINGFEVIAEDKAGYDTKTKVKNTILKPTDGVALVCVAGTSIFDFIYGSNINKAKFDDINYKTNFYDGQFSDDLLSTAFGDLVYYSNNDAEEDQALKTMVDEFGTVAREIAKVDVKFDARPSYPIYWSTADNPSVSILGAKQTNFRGSSFLLNNTSTTVPISDGNAVSFYMLGNTLASSGSLEYSTDELADYVAKEPVIFESKWLQDEADVKSFANWIKDEIVNKGQIVSLSVFGNPLIALGDIITLNYPLQGFNGEERFIVTSVRHSYMQGLETTIECRSINKTAKEAVENTPVPTTLTNTTEVDNTAKLTVPTNSGPGYNFDYWNAIGAVGQFGTAGGGSAPGFHIAQWRKPDSGDSVIVIATINNDADWTQIANLTETNGTFDLNTIPARYLRHSDTAGNKYVTLKFFAVRGSNRGPIASQDFDFQYTA